MCLGARRSAHTVSRWDRNFLSDNLPGFGNAPPVGLSNFRFSVYVDNG